MDGAIPPTHYTRNSRSFLLILFEPALGNTSLLAQRPVSSSFAVDRGWSRVSLANPLITFLSNRRPEETLPSMSGGASQPGDPRFYTLPPGPALPQLPSSSAGHTHETQSSRAPIGTMPPSIEHRQSQASSLGRRTPDALMEEGDDEELHANAGSSAPSARRETFPYTLYRIIQDEKMSKFIRWFQREDKYGFFIPDRDAFVRHVLPKFFPGMKDWWSFQRQLDNYQFKKDDRNSAQGLFFHCGNMFRPDHEDLLSKVVPKRKSTKRKSASASQKAVKKQQPPPPPPPSISVPPNDVSHPTAPRNDSALIDYLIQEVSKLTTNQKELQEENRKLKERVAKLEEAQTHHHPAMDNRIAEVEMPHPTMNGKQDVVFNGSSLPTFPPRPTTTALNDGSPMARGSGPSGIGHALPPVTNHEGIRTVPDVPYQQTTIDPALLSRQSLYSSYSSTPHVGSSVYYTGAHPQYGGPPREFYSTDGPFGSNALLPQITDPTAGAPLPAQQVPEPAQMPAYTQGLNDPRASGKRSNASAMTSVPTPPPPWANGPVGPYPSSSGSISAGRYGSPSRFCSIFGGTGSFSQDPRR